MKLDFSFIIPVYNRPTEVDELLESFTRQTVLPYEIIIVEDGSILRCNEVVNHYEHQLNIKYYFKENTGAGLSRNFGMQKVSGNYFIILDSDVLLPENYIEIITNKLTAQYSDFFGGPDAAHPNFTHLQKAINYSMTSVFTTGGLRGGKKNNVDFQPRSFNLGMSKTVFQASGGFSGRKTGEDIELSFTLKKLGFSSQLISEAFVYHKRRTDLGQFFKQTYNFGKERPLLNKEFPKTAKLTYWFPSAFTIGLGMSLILLALNCAIPIVAYLIYFLLIFVDASFRNKSISIGFLSMITTLTQFAGYGFGFIKSVLKQKRLTK